MEEITEFVKWEKGGGGGGHFWTNLSHPLQTIPMCLQFPTFSFLYLGAPLSASANKGVS